MNPFSQASAAGYGAGQILSYLSNAAPSMKKKIDLAKQAGYAAENIVNFFSNQIDATDNRELKHSNRVSLEKQQKKNEFVKDIGMTAVKEAAAIGAATYGAKAVSGLFGKGNQGQPSIQNQNVAKPSLEQKQVPAPIEKKPIDSIGLLDQLGVRKQVDAMMQSKNPLEVISSVVANGLSQEIRKKMKSGTIPPLDEIIKDYVSKSPEQTTDIEVEKSFTPMQEAKLGNQVLTPDGHVGEVKGLDKNGVVVFRDGKAEKYSLEDLQEEPDQAKQIIEYLLQMPEEEKSSNVSMYLRDPSSNTIFIQYHDGEVYKYNDVSEEYIKKIAEKEAIPITEGENIFGKWSSGDKKSLGAAVSRYLLKDPKYARPKKGEPNNKNYTKLESYYDYWKKVRTTPKKPK